MDSSGRMYMPPEQEEILRKMFEDRVDKLTRAVRDVEFVQPPADAMPIEDENIARELAGMNRAARLAFYSERRRGEPEAAAIEAARSTLP